MRYKAWGETRYAWGAPGTDYRYTGQREEAGIGLYYYRARWYDPVLGRFAQADTMGAGDRFAYGLNNPVKFSDPSGNYADEGCGQGGPTCTLPIPPTPPSPTPPDPPDPDDYDRHESAGQALTLVLNWFFEMGPEVMYFGPEDSLTLDVIYDPALEEFREAWAAAGHRIPFTRRHERDERYEGALAVRVVNALPVFIEKHFVEMPLSFLGLGSRTPQGPVDPVGGTIGSLDTITVTRANDGNVLFTVYNEMGRASVSRIPGTNHSFMPNVPRSASGLGGTTYQYFLWEEAPP